ncbi:MAG: four helix bundle protein [Brumimicrobium sp.]
MNHKKYDLEERLIDFSVDVVKFHEFLKPKKPSIHLGGQLIRSGTSPSLNYGEANAAESKRDFIHKMKVCLKELRETYNCLRIINGAELHDNSNKMKALLIENNELISIFVASINTAKRTMKN